MHTPTTTSEYLILFRNTGWDQGLSPEEMQKIMSEVRVWFERLAQAGKLKAAQPLSAMGRLVSGKEARTVDGPFAESKETIGGYLLLRVEQFEEAVAIAQTWPLLPYGSTAEVRPVAAMCPQFQQLGEAMSSATA